jgi:hypothetical protein
MIRKTLTKILTKKENQPVSEKTGAYFFNGRGIGRKLKEVTVDLIKTDNDDVISRWFHSEPGTDLFTWTDHKHNIIKQQISFNGQVVEWNCLEGIKTGVVIESDLSPTQEQYAEIENKSSETIQFDPKPQGRSIDLALEILRYMEGDAKLLLQLIDNFENPQNIKTMKPEDFILRFGLAVKNYQKINGGFWAYCKKRFSTLFKTP